MKINLFNELKIFNASLKISMNLNQSYLPIKSHFFLSWDINLLLIINIGYCIFR